jgi:hypothetical protein
MAQDPKPPGRSSEPRRTEETGAGDPVADIMAGEQFSRNIGRRQRAPRSTASAVAPLPDAAARDAWTRLAQYRTRVPKGVFIYATHDAANRDWERWRLDAMREAALSERNG